jgi:hypothetical protein
MTKFSVENLVIGSGLMGSGVALELAKRGKSSLLVDQDPEIMNRASLRNEGKIHLGLIYAADKSLRTGIDQLSGALSFFRILESWVGDKIDEIEISSPFIYLVAKDSLLKGEELASYYRSLQEYFDDQFKKKNLNSYLGKKLDHLYKRLSLQSANHLFETRGIESVFQTSERAINTDYLKKVISAAIQSDPAIEWCGNTKVINIESHENSYLITCFKKDTNEEIKISAKKVFNASWDQRLKLDSTLGIKPIDGWLHRLKYRVLVKTPRDMNLQSATMVLGSYGDVVIRDQSSYLSWYPVCMKGWSHDLSPPKIWEDVCKGSLTGQYANNLAQQTIKKIASWYPAISDVEILSVDAGVIFAHGQLDVNHIDSELHQRTTVGINRQNNFFSINSGKLTTAPLFAIKTVDMAFGAQ